MKAKEGFVLREIVGEYMLMPAGDNVGKYNGTVILNVVSAFIWEKLQNEITKESLLEAILKEFDVDRETAEQDMNSLLDQFKEIGLI